MEPLLDLPQLRKRIKELTKTYSESAEVLTDPENPLFIQLLYFLRDQAFQVAVDDKAYWGHIRFEDPKRFVECILSDKLRRKSKVVGKGAFGTMWDVPVASCMRFIPNGVKHVAVKVEKVSPKEENQAPERLQEVAVIAKKAAALKIGPKFYDMFVTKDSENQYIIVKIMELIHGTSWANTEWKSPAVKKKAVKQLSDAIELMNKSGIIHHDLHDGNVMVAKSGKVYIVDYDRANLISHEEVGQLYQFNNSVRKPWDLNEMITEKRLLFLFDRLVKEGSIIEVSTKEVPANASTNKKTRKHKRR